MSNRTKQITPKDRIDPTEIVVARLSSGLSLHRCISQASTDDKIRILIGRNKQANIPKNRILMFTGITTRSEEELRQLQNDCESLASDIDLSEIWEITRDEPIPISLDSLAELYWTQSPTTIQKVSLLLHIDRNSTYFFADGDSYLPRDQSSVQEIQKRQQLDTKQAHEEALLIEHLQQDCLPEPLTNYQSDLLQHLKGYVIYGEDYTRSTLAKKLIQQIEHRARDLQQISFNILVKVGMFSPDEPLELEQAKIHKHFTDDILDETAGINISQVLEKQHRTDLSAVRTITIDNAKTQDMDDAISLEIETPENNQSNSTPENNKSDSTRIYRLGIHISDVGALIKPKSLLDIEADYRMASVYLPEIKIPMFPSELSDKTASLSPGQTRGAVSLIVRIDENGEILNWEIFSSIIRSHVALSYEDADQIITDPTHPDHNILSILNLLAIALEKKRGQNGAINIDRPEILLTSIESDKVSMRVIENPTPSRKLVREFMILCNQLMASFCEKQNLPAAYRSQDEFDISDIPEDPKHGPLWRHLVIRRLQPANIGTTPRPHAGLGVTSYTQVTSPIRRYPDLIMQRQISSLLNSNQALYSSEEIASVAQRADVQLRELGKLEEARKHYWLLKYMKQNLLNKQDVHPSDIFTAIVLDNQTTRLALMELLEYPLRVKVELPPKCEPGDTVTLHLQGVDLWQRACQFVYLPPA